MAKGIGYYEHDIKVRFTEERINKSSNWQWLIECTEERFSAPKEITSVNEFIGVLASLHEPLLPSSIWLAISNQIFHQCGW